MSSEKALPRILIVEDDIIIANDIASLLRHNGYSVSGIATNERKAIFHLRQAKTDLAILDISMENETDGISIAEKIKDHFHIPFIFLTSFSDSKTINLAKENEPAAFLVKPFQDQTLLATIAVALSNFDKREFDRPDFTRLNDVLTDAEMRVCKELVTGLTYEEIAEKIHVSKNTVRFHAKNIFFKLDISKRSGIIDYLNNATNEA